LQLWKRIQTGKPEGDEVFLFQSLPSSFTSSPWESVNNYAKENN